MTSPRLWKTWKVSDALLRRARLAVSPPAAPSKEEFDRLDEQFAEMLGNNEHELALDMLEEIGFITDPRGGFWKDLERAAANMGLDDRIPRLRLEFDKALARITDAEQAGTGQPATRPESNSEGSDKPQPEAEGRSR